jgi:predicted RNase H-like HicB family nuclease
MKIVVQINRMDNGWYRAWCPALPGCLAMGESQEEAASRISGAISGYLASMDVVAPTTELLMTAG